MLIGLVKWFDEQKGFGLIGNPEEGEFFLLKDYIVDADTSIIKKGTAVLFSKEIDSKRNRNNAKNCKRINSTYEWEYITAYLAKPDRVAIEVISTETRRGRTITKRETEFFSVKHRGAYQIFSGKDIEDISKMITDYFDNGLPTDLFISYCEFIEKIIAKDINVNKKQILSDTIFSHFGKYLDSQNLFKIWKIGKFQFIGKTSKQEGEIPKSVLLENKNEIGFAEFRRIVNYENGKEICDEIISSKFSELSNLSKDEILSLYDLLQFLTESKSKELKSLLDDSYTEKILPIIEEIAKTFEPIRNETDFIKYSNLQHNIPSQISPTKRDIIQKRINNITESNCHEDFKFEIWLKGITNEVSYKEIDKAFLERDSSLERKALILSKLKLESQLELLKQFAEIYGYEEAYGVLEGLVKKENTVEYGFKLSNKLFDKPYWENKKHFVLIEEFSKHVIEKSTDSEKFSLLLKGLMKDVPHRIILDNLDKVNFTDCEIVFRSNKENQDLIFEILVSKISACENSVSYNWVYNLAKEYLDADNFSYFDKKAFEIIDKGEYFKLWLSKMGRIFPSSQIEAQINEGRLSIDTLQEWVRNEVATSEELCECLLSSLSRLPSPNDRIVFHQQQLHITYILKLDGSYLDEIKELKNQFHNVILWYLDYDNFFDFDLLKSKFIFFSPEEQVRIIKKLFHLKVKGEFDLTVEKLDELVRIDLDLYKINSALNPNVQLDVSTDVIIKALISYQQKSKFLVESELLTIVLDNLKSDKSRRFKLENYFEGCKGRQVAQYNWDRNGEIKKVNFGDNRFYFAIEFPTGHTTTSQRGWDTFHPNPNFDWLKDEVKKLPKAKWNVTEKHWGVPSEYESDVLAFAKKCRFYLNFEGNKWDNNIHLVEFSRSNVPNGITFCEGRLANRAHEKYKKEFWWCCGQACFQKCETIHIVADWEKYTLLDFCEILGLSTDEINRVGDTIAKGHYYQFIGLINRFNQLLDRLYCKDCDEMLNPVDTSHFAVHNVVRFHCVNEKCSNREEVYLTHCLNGQCNSIIDSRISVKCPNGLVICNECGSCCSHDMLSRRLNNLQKVGGYIHRNLVNSVENKLGHLERAEYFCYKCKASMVETSKEIFECNSCNVKYDTTIFRFNRPHRHLSKREAADTAGNHDFEEEPS